MSEHSTVPTKLLMRGYVRSWGQSRRRQCSDVASGSAPSGSSRHRTKLGDSDPSRTKLAAIFEL